MTAKRTVVAAVAALGLLTGGGLIEEPGGAQASWSWGATNSGTGGATAREEAATERGEDPTESRNPDRPSPELMG
jgi:hypothetical protein